MGEHFNTLASVFPIIINSQAEILLHLRQGTGYMDGYWDLAGTGHIEAGELPTEAVIRECEEELGIQVKSDWIRFAYVNYRSEYEQGPTYNYYYFFVDSFEGEPRIMEPHKNAALKWAKIEELPHNMIPNRRQSIERALAGEAFAEWRS